MNDPWKGLAPTISVRELSARRVDAENRWNFFWARDVEGRCLLVLRHEQGVLPVRRLPSINGLGIQSVTYGENAGHALIFTLLDSAQREIFHRLCLDIVQSAAVAESEQAAIEVAIARTWRWHHLLRGGSDGRLSSEEQKGLIGELLFIEDCLLSRLAPSDAVASWKGPLGAPKDFEIGRLCVEAKARRGAATPHVAMSSEHQLDISGVDQLFLHVAEVDRLPSSRSDGSSITEIARRVRDRIAAVDDAAAADLDALLHAAGFRWSDDYSDSAWICGDQHIFRVTEDFPAISASRLPLGLANVRYAVALAACEPFRVTREELDEELEKGAGHGA